MPGGYAGRFLEVNLTQRTTSLYPIDENVLRQYIGGSSLGARLLCELAPAGVDPLSPENPLIFATGPLVGTKVPSSGRHSVVAKSPLTGIWGEASVGGTWGTELRYAGRDGLIVTGKAESPLYLYIHDETVEFRDAKSAWGQDTYQVDDLLKGETDPSAVVCSIGPAGEKLIPVAAIMTDGREGRAAARCGLGAVMGSKNLKAVVVRGTGSVPVTDPGCLDASLKSFLPRIVEKTKILKEYGTPGLVLGCEQMGDFPVKNWRLGRWQQGAEKISGQRLAESYLTGRYYCKGCVIGCGRKVHLVLGDSEESGGGPEYETLGLFGGSCQIDDLPVIIRANELCNRYGLDTIEVGNAVAFAMEAYERGLITSSDAGGVSLEWGSAGALIELIHQIGQAKSLGRLLGQGLRAAASAIGGLAPEFAIHTKGLSFPAHDPRAYNSMALGYATSNRGACHLQAFSHAFERNLSMPEIGIDAPRDRFSVEGKAEMVARLQDVMCVFDSVALCKFLLFGGVGLNALTEWVSAVTGWDMTPGELLKAGERAWNLKRLYNVACGISRKDDALPPRIATQPRREGGAADNLPPMGKMLSEYYQVRGWTDEGIPSPEKIAECGLAGLVR